MMPAREGEFCPKDEDILALLSQVEAENIAPYVDNVKDEPLVSELPTAGKVVKENMLSDFGAKEWILSNGAKVILKKTDFKSDEISVMAVLLVVMIRLLICFLCRLYWNNMVWVTLLTRI